MIAYPVAVGEGAGAGHGAIWKIEIWMRNKMDETIKAMIDALEEYGAGFISVSNGKYTIMITDDKEGAEFLKEKWDEYIEN